MKVDLLVIGAGITGTWVALTAARKGLFVVVYDDGKEGITARNSGVLHAGLYYPQNNKAFHCVRGREWTVGFLHQHNVPYNLCGKLVVGDEDSVQKLEANARTNGVQNLEIVNPQKFSDNIVGKYALHSKDTGIVDVPSYMKRLRAVAETEGVIFLRNKEEELEPTYVVNAAGLYSDEIAKELGLQGYEIRPNKGEYYRLKRTFPLKKLVYPVPNPKEKGALGVHFTFNMNDECYAGPSTRDAKNKTDYEIETDAETFHNSLSRILNYYTIEDFVEGYVGLRPRLYFNGEHFTDFAIVEFNKAIHLLGIESPGLTSAPSIAFSVVERLV
jgi:L-2-hydroxyglutarate oxidase LhgO